MKLKVNSSLKEFDSAQNLEQFIYQILKERENYKGVEGIAVAVNQSVVPRENWPTLSLKEKDEITILQAVQGG